MTTAANRIISLDIFRGLTIMAMIIVNTPRQLGFHIPGSGAFGKERLYTHRPGVPLLYFCYGFCGCTFHFREEVKRYVEPEPGIAAFTTIGYHFHTGPDNENLAVFRNIGCFRYLLV